MFQNDGAFRRISHRRLARRTALQVTGAGLAAAALGTLGVHEGKARQAPSTPATGSGTSSAGDIPIGGQAVPELTVFDQLMSTLMAEWSLPGGQLALAKDGRLVFDRSYGYADVELGEPVQPDALFRIASVSKTITTVAILALVQDGLLALDDRAFHILDDLEPPANALIDPRLDEITVEQLLVHAGGWDSVTNFDPQFQPWTWNEAGVLGVEAPPSAEEIVRAMLGVPLDFDPGTKSVYSNFGFNVLGRVIEHVSGQGYEAYVQEHVLAPAGITAMRLGRTRLADRAPGEVRYYAAPGETPSTSVFPGEGYVPWAYGNFYMEALDAHGGWIASAADLVRFATAIDGRRGPALLEPAMVEAMLETPRPATPEGAAGAGNAAPGHGLGWTVTPAGDGVNWAHAGALEGSTASWLARTHDGLAIAFNANSLPADYGSFFGAAVSGLLEAAAGVTAWPETDLFAVEALAATPGA